MEAIKPSFVKFLQTLHDTQVNRSSLAGNIAKNMAKLKQFGTKSEEYESGQYALMLVASSLKLIKTVFMEAQYFWKDQVEFIKNYLAQVMSADFPTPPRPEIVEIAHRSCKEPMSKKLSLETNFLFNYWIFFW